MRMILYAACLSVAVAVVAATAALEDTSNALRIKPFYPGERNNPSDSLRVRCSVNVNSTDFDHLIKLKLLYSDKQTTFIPLGALAKGQVKYGRIRRYDKSEWSQYELNTDYSSKLEITWYVAGIGYCRYYKCVASGRHPESNRLMALYKVNYIKAPKGQTCDTK